MSRAPGFIRPIAAASMRLAVAGISGTCRLTMSARAKQLDERSYAPRAQQSIDDRVVKHDVDVETGQAPGATCLPIAPAPTRPTVLPGSSDGVIAPRRSQRPSLTLRSCCRDFSGQRQDHRQRLIGHRR